ncbi:MAG: hypothetical protein QXL19_05970 [Ignisphaera sp.]
MNMKYEVNEKRDVDNRRHDLKSFAKKLEEMSLRLSYIYNVPLTLRNVVSKSGILLNFHTPVKSSLLKFSDIGENVIMYDYKSFEVSGIGVNLNNIDLYEIILEIKTYDGVEEYIHLSFSELLAFLFYSGAYEKIRKGEYDGSTEVAEIIMDVAELVYNDPKVLQLCNSVLFEEQKSIDKPIQRLAFIIRWEPEPRMSGYAGISVYHSEDNYSLIISDGSILDISRLMIRRPKEMYRYRYGEPLSISFSTARMLPMVKTIIDSFYEVKDEIENYINNLKISHLAVRMYKKLIGEDN